jgi:hypothetical protein
MGAIKDVVDLVLDLEQRTTDRKILDALFPIKQKIHEAEKEQLQLEKAQFQMEKAHHQEMTELKKAHAEEIAALNKSHNEETVALKQQLVELQGQNSPAQVHVGLI